MGGIIYEGLNILVDYFCMNSDHPIKATIIESAHDEHDAGSELDGLLYHVLIKAYVR